ncbi:polysaccharide deacetylase family protein [Endozoicomonas sp. SESOKO4]|uniref:polysaccharide deacetylase family protein n=1 Tax=Endozoicomonas sp. SESOKO4 TaxID=2828745 RepID=UPI002148F634|nr:polysaccharide deacetylase family protein [Endozoicomonas sp. SESOKO4]
MFELRKEADFYYENSDWKNSSKCFSNIIKQDKSPQVYIKLVKSKIKEGQTDSAKSILKEAIELYPRGYNFYRLLGSLFYDEQNWFEAIIYFEKYCKIANNKARSEVLQKLKASKENIRKHLLNSEPNINKKNKEKLSFNTGLISITYDDGRLNNYQFAYPLHKKHKVPATFFVITDRLFDNKLYKNFLSLSDAYEVSNFGIEISSHTASHDGTRLTEMDISKLDYELKSSQNLLKEKLNIYTKSLAIPYSKYNKQVLSHASKYYENIRIDGNKFNHPTNDKTLLVYSHPVRNTTTFEDIKKLIDQAATEKTWLVLMLHGVHDKQQKGAYDCDVATLEKNSFIYFIAR